jgi:transcriptional repressor NrdR
VRARPAVRDTEARELAGRANRDLQELGEREVTSRWIGEHVMEGLVELDTLAAARFASVFLNFQGADDYTRFFASLDALERKPRSS